MCIMGSILYFLFAVIMRRFKVCMVYMRNRSFFSNLLKYISDI